MSMANTLLRGNMRATVDPDSTKRAIVRGRSMHLLLALAIVCAAVPRLCANDAAARQNQPAAGLQDRSPRAPGESARDGAGIRGHAVRWIDARGQCLRDQAAAGRAGTGDDRRFRAGSTDRRRLSRRGALRLSDRSRAAFRRYRAAARLAAEARSRQQELPEQRGSRREIHRLRARRQAVRPERRAVQYLRARPRPVRQPDADESRRVGAARSSRAGIRNTVGFDWDPRHARALVYRQRPRHAGRRPAARRAQSRAARPA